MKAYGVPSDVVTPTKLSSALQSKVSYLTFHTQDAGPGQAEIDVEVRDAAGEYLLSYFRIRCWTSTTDFGAPVTQNTFCLCGGSGVELEEHKFNADYTVITSNEGYVTMDLEVVENGEYYIMAELDGRVYSTPVVITSIS